MTEAVPIIFGLAMEDILALWIFFSVGFAIIFGVNFHNLGDEFPYSAAILMFVLGLPALVATAILVGSLWILYEIVPKIFKSIDKSVLWLLGKMTKNDYD